MAQIILPEPTPGDCPECGGHMTRVTRYAPAKMSERVPHGRSPRTGMKCPDCGYFKPVER